jgi:hypothetical protein
MAKIKLNPLLLFICSVLMIIFSCKKDDIILYNTCDVKNPVKDLVWMRDDINFIEQLSPEISQYITIWMAIYNGETVFYSKYCDPDVDSVYPIRNCSGITIGYWGEISPEDLINQQVIWKSKYCICV